MQRSRCLLLAILAGALTLTAGLAQPALAQVVQPGGDQLPIQGFIALPRDKAVILSWSPLTNALGYNVYRRNPGQAATAAVLMNPTGPVLTSSAVDGPLVNKTPYIYFVKPVFQDAAGKAVEGAATTASRDISVTPNPLIQPGGLALFDFGTITPGTADVASNILTLRASGQDIWAGTDQGSFVAVPISTDKDFTVTVKMTEKPKNDTNNTRADAKIGLMIKYSLQPGSAYAYNFASTNREPEFRIEARRSDGTTGGAGGSSPAQADVKYPVWLRFVKTGTMIQPQFSTDAAGADNTFKDVDPALDMNDMPPVVYVGIAGTSHDPNNAGYVIGKIDLSTFKIVKQ